jgi:integrase
MPKKAITDAWLRNLKPPRKDKQRQVAYIDTMERGLALVVVNSYGGTRTFRVMTYKNGKPQSRKLGTYPQMTVKEARAKAREYFANPQKFAAQAETGSFRAVADKWLRQHVEGRLLSQREIERQLERYVFPKWKDRPFFEIRRGEVNDLLDHIAHNHGRPQADGVLGTVRSIMNWYQTRVEDYTSPIVKGMKSDKREPKERARSRFLDDDEIRAVWKATEDMGTFGAFVRVALLTGQRREKVSTMRWEDVRDGVWTIPQESKREKGTAGKVKLPQMALGIIQAQPQLAGNPFVFAGRGRAAFNSFSQRKAELDKKLAPTPAWVLHDLRRTCRKLMSRARVRPDVAELALGHSIKGIQAIYDDPMEYRPLVDQALQRVADEVERIINPPPGNVVPLRG